VCCPGRRGDERAGDVPGAFLALLLGRLRRFKAYCGGCNQALGEYPRLAEDWLLIADRGFCGWDDWRAAAATGAALLWPVKADAPLPVQEILPDGPYPSVLVRPGIRARHGDALIETAPAGGPG
jgi:hypothetical protein